VIAHGKFKTYQRASNLYCQTAYDQKIALNIYNVL